MSDFEVPFGEYEPALEALNGFGRQLLEAATGRADGALAQGIEQLVFRNPDGISFKTIDPAMLQLFIEANVPNYNSLLLLQRWRDTDGLIESAHVWWRSQSSYYEVFGQVRAPQTEADDRHALEYKITMEQVLGDMCAVGADVRLGDLNEFGNFKNGLSIAFDRDTLHAPSDSQALEWLGYLTNEIRSTFSYAEVLEDGSNISAYRYPIVS